MTHRYLDLILLLALTITVVILRLLGIEDGIILMLTGAIFVLFAPGYAISQAIFKEGSLGTPAIIALGIGISLAITAVGGIGLYGSGAFLTATSWTVFLASIILGGSLAAFIQRIHNTSFSPNYATRKLGFSEALLLIFSILTLSGGIYLAILAEKNQTSVPFTEFWIIPETEEMTVINIGLHNYEQINMIYEISIHINGHEVETWENILVQSDNEWIREFPLPPKETPDEIISVYLYTNEETISPYRWGQLFRK